MDLNVQLHTATKAALLATIPQSRPETWLMCSLPFHASSIVTVKTQIYARRHALDTMKAYPLTGI